MFTRFRTPSAVHVFDAPLIHVPPDIPGAGFLGALGGAYRYEEEHLRSRLLQFAGDLQDALEGADYKMQRGVARFLDALGALIDFLNSVPENAVLLYSYDRAPSLNDLLDAFSGGGGARDWALEELGERGEKGRKSLISALRKERNRDKLLSAISMLLILYRDEHTVASIKRFIDDCESELGRDAATLLAAYTSAS